MMRPTALSRRRKHALGLCPSPGVGPELVGHDLVAGGSSLAVCKRLDVNEDLLPASVGGDEAKAPVVLPACYSALVSHTRSSRRLWPDAGPGLT